MTHRPYTYPTCQTLSPRFAHRDSGSQLKDATRLNNASHHHRRRDFSAYQRGDLRAKTRRAEALLYRLELRSLRGKRGE